MTDSIILLQSGGGFLGVNGLFLIGMLAVVYFFMILPQQRKAKKESTFQEELKKGDEVVTSSGIIGKISKIEDNIVTLSLDGKTTCRFTKGAISLEMTEALFPPAKDA